MKSTILKVFMCIAMLSMAFSNLHAQEIITVTGKILKQAEGGKGKPEPFPSGSVTVLGFYTIAGAEDAMKLLEAEEGYRVFPDARVDAESDGFYEIRVTDNGALIILGGMQKKLIKVEGKEVINQTISVALDLEEVVVQAESPIIKVPPKAGKMVGDKLVVDNKATIPSGYGAANRRLIMQPFVLDCTTEDTIKFVDPVVIDGVEYGLTQDRRMAFDMKNDALARFIKTEKDLHEGTQDVQFSDSVRVPDPKRTYNVYVKISIADYTRETHSSEQMFTTCKIKRPMQFLEFSFPEFQLDPYKYQEKPRREKMNTAANISLTFAVNKAELDPEDPNNEVQMNKLLEDLNAIIYGEGTTLKEFKIKGISSPEGRYAPNLALAERRTIYAKNYIASRVPAGKWARVLVHKPEARVATWDEMADLLEQDTLLNEAAEIRAITAKYDSHDAQYADIRRLPYYETLIKNRLPRLRKLEYEYVHEIYRELKPHEILYRYQNDPEYRDGRKAFTKYEYWHLFQQVNDPKEAEKIYRRAYNDHMTTNENGKKQPWLLAANNLAVSLLRRDTFDVNILEPLINYNRPVNAVNKTYDDFGGVRETEINPEDMIANQLAMYIRTDNYEKATILADKLPMNDKFKMIKAFAKCLGGHYDYRSGVSKEEREERREIFELVRSSSPMNNAVMCMAMEMANYDMQAKEVLEQMEPTTQIKYMKLQLFIREKKLHDPKWVFPGSDEETNFKDACKMLDAIIKEDPKYRKIAENDGEISKEFMEYFADPFNWDDSMMYDF